MSPLGLESPPPSSSSSSSSASVLPPPPPPPTPSTSTCSSSGGSSATTTGSSSSGADFFSRALPTKNNRGFDMGVVSWGWQQWVDAYDGVLPLLDVGSGLGTNTLAALEKGHTKVVALDMTQEHLDTIRSRAGDEAVASGRLRTVLGELPDVRGVEDGSVSAILCAQVIHFLSPSAFEASMGLFARWVKPGGLVLVLATSFYQNIFLPQPDDDEQEPAADGAADASCDRSLVAMEVEAQLPGQYPGWFPQAPDVTKWAKVTAHKGQLSAEALSLLQSVKAPSHHFYHPAQLRRACEAVGLEVLSCELAGAELCGLPSFLTITGDDDNPFKGKEQVVLVARRPRQ